MEPKVIIIFASIEPGQPAHPASSNSHLDIPKNDYRLRKWKMDYFI